MYIKLAFTLGSAALAVTGTLLTGNPLSAAGAVVSLVQFATLDRNPVIQAGDAAPAAMLHDIQALVVGS